MIILDADVLAEPMRAVPSAEVMSWLNAQAPDALFTTTITLAELYAGIAVLPAARRRSELAASLRAAVGRLFGARVLGFDVAAAESFALLAERARSSGLSLRNEDAQIAAIAAARGFAIATRSVGSFAGTGVTVINPWEPIGIEGGQMNEVRIREIVTSQLGAAYEFVIASGISRYLSVTGRWSAADDRDIANLAVKAKRLFDAHEEIFMGRTHMAIGDRREIICRFLRGEDVRPLLTVAA